MLTFFAFIEKVPRVRNWLHDRPLLDRFVPFLYWAGAFFLVWGFYAAWSEQRAARNLAEEKLEVLTRPNFIVKIGQSLGCYLPSDGFTMLLAAKVFGSRNRVVSPVS